MKLTVVRARVDVIHSWWIPELGGKIDAIPGRDQHTWFRADETGSYAGKCAELCGIQHARMKAIVRSCRGRVRGVRRTRAADRQPAFGKQEWEGVCAKCHRLQGEGASGRRSGATGC